MLRHYARLLRESAVDFNISSRYLIKTLTKTTSDLPPHPEIYRGENKDYQRFILLAHQRSGSSMVVGTLRTHPQIFTFNEIFVSGQIDFNVQGYDNNSAELLYMRKKSPIEFLEHYIFTGYHKNIKAAGFKMFPEQMESRNNRKLWKWLDDNRNVKIIFLTREDLLATYTSLMIARKTGTYGIKDKSQRTNTTIIIDPKKLSAVLRERKSHNDETDKKLVNNDVLKISYEDMVVDLNNSFMKFQKFIGVDVQSLEVTTVKKEVRPLSEVIINYEELRKYYSGTEWSYLFSE